VPRHGCRRVTQLLGVSLSRSAQRSVHQHLIRLSVCLAGLRKTPYYETVNKLLSLIFSILVILRMVPRPDL